MSSSSPTVVRTAVVGAGLISDIHIRGLQAHGVEVVAVVDTDAARAAAKAQAHGIARSFGDVAQMLAATSPDVVHVLTPPATHASVAIAALEAGAHVYVEKPLAASVEDCDRMIAAAAASGRQLCAGHSLVYDPLMRQLAEAIDAGAIGEVLGASAVYCFDPRRIPGYNSKGWYRRLAGGFVEDLASHPASLLLTVLGGPAEATGAAALREDGSMGGMTALIRGRRAAGTLVVSLDARPEEVSLVVRGTRGMAYANFSTMVAAVVPERRLPKKLAHGVRNFELAGHLAVQTFTNTARFLTRRMDTTKGIHTLIGAFYDALAAGSTAPVSGEDGREVVRVLRALWPADASAAARPARWTLHRPTDWTDAPFGRDGGATTPMTALVTGATGFIGTHLVRTLAERGVRVRALARSPEKGRRLAGEAVEVVVGDFADPDVIPGLAEGADVVFHLASVMTGAADEFEQVDLAGGARLFAEAKRAGVRRVVFTSTMGAYALAELDDGAVVTEEMTDEPTRVGNYSRAKLLLEEMLREAHGRGDFEAVITRPGLVFGPGTSPYLEHLPHLGSLRGDRYVVMGDGRVPLQLTYVENTVEALWLAAVVPQAAGETFTIIDDDLPTQREFVRRLAELTRRPLRVTAVPRPVVWGIGMGVETLSAVLRRRPPTTRRLLRGKTVKLRFATERAKRVLGWTPAVRWEEGLQRAVESAGAGGNGAGG